MSTIDLTPIKDKLSPKIEQIGFKLEQYNDNLLETYHHLDLASVAIPDNLLNPNIDDIFLAVYASIIYLNPEEPGIDISIKSLAYIYPETGFRHVGLVSNAIQENNLDLLPIYRRIFSDNTFSKNKKAGIALLVSHGQAYEHLLASDVTDEDVENEITKFMKSIRKPINHAERLASFN